MSELDTAPEPQSTPAVPPAAPPPPPATPSPSTAPSKPVASNAQPGVDLESGQRVDDAADTAKRDDRVRELATQYDDPTQRQRLYDKFEVDAEGTQT